MSDTKMLGGHVTLPVIEKVNTIKDKFTEQRRNGEVEFSHVYDYMWSMFVELYDTHGNPDNKTIAIPKSLLFELGGNDPKETVIRIIRDHINNLKPKPEDRVGTLVHEIMERNKRATDWTEKTAINQTILDKEGGFGRALIKRYLEDNAAMIDDHHHSVGIDDPKEHNRKVAAHLRRKRG